MTTFEDYVKPKYFNQHEPNYVFNVDLQPRDAKFVIVVEGPFDSMFLDNAIATADANLSMTEYLGKDNLILVFDNEPRNKFILKYNLIVYILIYVKWKLKFPILLKYFYNLPKL